MKFLATLLLTCLLPLGAAADEIRAIGFNIERGFRSDAEIDAIAEIMRHVGYADLWAFSEVSEGDETALKAILGSSFDVRLGSIGDDHLAVAFNEFVFDFVRLEEVPLTNPGTHRRRPLAVLLEHEDTGTRFWFVANHLLRGQGDDPDRAQEAEDLNAWATAQSEPAIAMGDFNLDFDVPSATFESQAAASLTAEGVWVWIVPDKLLRTHCGDFNSILDFAFVAGAARAWPASSVVVPTLCGDDERQPDHRPLELLIDIR